MDETRLTDPEETPEDRELDRSLRPRSFDEFVGQEQIKANLISELDEFACDTPQSDDITVLLVKRG